MVFVVSSTGVEEDPRLGILLKLGDLQFQGNYAIMVVLLTDPHGHTTLRALEELIGASLLMLADLVVVDDLGAAHGHELAEEFELRHHVLDGPVNLLKLGSLASLRAVHVVSLPLLQADLTERLVAGAALETGLSDYAKADETLNSLDELLHLLFVLHTIHI